MAILFYFIGKNFILEMNAFTHTHEVSNFAIDFHNRLNLCNRLFRYKTKQLFYYSTSQKEPLTMCAFQKTTDETQNTKAC